ncbi:MbnP family copper-binding protein [Alteromonas sp. CYL-A6]|uniref:MbnP family copper-binding protein n=1 Tax=Alteromonas nitratireducens TaxID=3390813 RepID=UPI0034AB2D7A
MKLSRWIKNGHSTLLVLVMLLAGCDKLPGARAPGAIPVHLTGVNTSSCPMTMTVGEDRWEIGYFAFYVSKPELRIDGKWQPVRFKNSPWQTNDVALLSFHSLCNNAGAANTMLQLEASDKLMQLATNVRFTVGVPFEQNHANPLTQPSPLNDSSMFWSWQAGHKFMRLDLTNVASQHTFSYHLGSIGCESDAPVRPPAKACRFTNRVEMILPTTQLDSKLDLSLSMANLIAQVNLNASQGCMFRTPEEAPCDQLLRNLLTRPWLAWQ